MAGPKRSRGACVFCLNQHRKCDEARPRCGRCARLGKDCDYGKKLRWADGPQLPRAPRQRREARDAAVNASPEEAAHEDNDLRNLPSSFAPDAREARRHVASLIDALWPLGIDTYNEHAKRSLPYTAPPGSSGSPITESDGVVDDVVELSRSEMPVKASLNPPETFTSCENTTPDIIIVGSSLVPSATAFELWALRDTIHREVGTHAWKTVGEHLAYTYFVRSVSSIIPAWDGNENGYRQLAALALSTPVLMDTIISISSTYMHLRGCIPSTVALQRQSQALATLRGTIRALGGPNPQDQSSEIQCLKRDALATILLQLTVEMANGSQQMPVHIRFAMQLFKDLGYVRERPTLPVSTVLIQRMTSIDVYSAIYWHRRPCLPLSFWVFDDEDAPADTEPSFAETTGCSRWLMSLLAKVAHLAADREDGVSDAEIAVQAYALEASLHHLARRSFFDQDRAPAPEYLDKLCQCYYWSVVLLLQRRVFADAQDSRRVQMAVATLLDLMDRLPLGCGPDSSLSLPLYVAAFECIDGQQRARVRAKSCELTAQYPSKTREALTAAFDTWWSSMDGCGEANRGASGAAQPIDLVKDGLLLLI
ncbi:hypothetical protein GQ53DRAFT_429901 [Thozetella sp. PMI_491]|nr:hypothetical protein GQ53DRAFT_429901 [Thozetella sp. PMI_491]